MNRPEVGSRRHFARSQLLKTVGHSHHEVSSSLKSWFWTHSMTLCTVCTNRPLSKWLRVKTIMSGCNVLQYLHGFYLYRNSGFIEYFPTLNIFLPSFLRISIPLDYFVLERLVLKIAIWVDDTLTTGRGNPSVKNDPISGVTYMASDSSIFTMFLPVQCSCHFSKTLSQGHVQVNRAVTGHTCLEPNKFLELCR